MISLRVMLVDDEAMVLDDLRSMIKWERYGCSIVATATNGPEAVSLYRKYKPHILFIDICMPAMSGLEIVRTISESGDNVVIILLSAYRDFKYAQQAISYGVSRYLLKHELDARSLIGELLAARKKWESDQQKRTLLLQETLRDLLVHRDVPIEQICQRLGLGKGSCQGGLVLFVIKKEKPLTISDTDEPAALPMQELTLPDDLFDGYHLNVVAGLESAPLTRVFLLKPTAEVESTWNRAIVAKTARRLGSDTLERLSELNVLNCSVLFSVSCPNLKAVQNAYMVYEKVKGYTFFSADATDCPAVFEIEDLLGIIDSGGSRNGSCSSDSPVLEGFSYSQDVQHILDSLEGLQDDEMKKGINSLLERFRAAAWNLDRFKKAITLLYDSLCRFRSQHGLMPIRWENSEHTDWFRLEDAKRWFDNAFMQTAQALANAQPKRHNLEVHKAIEYMHRHYQKDISLEDVSLAAGISKSHLTHLFKKHLNTSVLKYLTAYRIGISKRLIRSGGFRMYEVSSLAGFSSNQYFSYVFRKATGMAPHFFSENCRKRPDTKEWDGLRA